jgi:Tol biopolymer transport system component
MKFRLTCLAAVLVAAVAFASAEQNDAARTMMEAARKKEVVDGDLKGAIQQYKAVAEKYKADRAVAADALVRMAECYQKLGDAEAQRIYARVVRDYGDQKDAVAIARTRLGSGGEPLARATGDRAVWTGSKVDLFGQVSPDGRYISYVDWGGDMNLMVHDLVANTDRALTPAPFPRSSQLAGFSAISKDGKQVAYVWSGVSPNSELRLLPLSATPRTEPRALIHSRDDIFSVQPHDWSSDGKWIAVNVQRADATAQIGLVSVADGTVRVLKSVDWRGARRILFSPDDRYIAYDLAAGESEVERHVFVMAVDGSREATVVADRSSNVVMGWTPDGQCILFASDRSGESALWAQRVTDGREQGQPALLKRDIGSSYSLGLTKTGTLFVYKSPSANYVQVASLDLEAAKIHAAVGKPFQRFVGSGGTPSWSRDGAFLVYRSCGAAPSTTCAINTASVDTGAVTQGWPRLTYLGGLRMSADHRFFFAVGRDLKGQGGAYRVDAKTFALMPLITPRAGALEVLSPDEGTLYFRRSDGQGAMLVARDLGTGAERELFRQSQNGSMTLSPDGRSILSVVSGTLYLVPAAGGTARQVLRAKADEFDGYRAEWTPDSRSVVIPKRLGDRIELWLVPMFDEGQPRKIDADTSGWLLPGGGFAIHPSGKQIAFTGMAGKQGAEVWALENFLAALKGTR